MIFLKNPSKMASLKLKICLKKRPHPEHKNSVTFVPKVGTKKCSVLVVKNNYNAHHETILIEKKKKVLISLI